MYDVIQLTVPKKEMNFNEAFSLGNFNESGNTVPTLDETLYTEAVFANGKQSVMPIVNTIQKIKDRLDEEIKKQEESDENQKDAAKKRKMGEHVTSEKSYKFDPKAFWRDSLFKDLEDEFSKIFGFRDVSIEPYIEKYNSSDKTFESRELNACIYHSDRFPIEGLVTDKGFYDKSKSIRMDIYITLGLIKALEAEEILAVILHEFGHGIDPALVDIKYTETNILSKYLTDRKHAINKNENKLMKKLSEVFLPGLIFIGYFLFIALFAVGGNFINWIREKILGKEKIQQEKLEKIKKILEKDKDKFTRQEFSEAFADNFARMYGFGPQLMRGLKKLSSNLDSEIKSRFKKERARQDIIVRITESAIKDVHKTDIHRARNLIKEYKEDIANPNTPAVVKKQLQEDLTELEKVLDEYMNNFDEFQNRVNQMINEELEKIELKEEKKAQKEEKKKEDDKPVTESTEVMTESRAAYEKLKKAEKSLSSEEYAEVRKKFGKTACSFGKDKNGYYCFTHRARSKSYESIDKIPQKSVDFICSTS